MHDSINDELSVAEERAAAQDRDILSLHSPISHLAELHPVVDVSPTTMVSEAMAKMAQKHVGCLLVTEGGKLAGLFSERDVLRKVATQNIDTKATPVSSLMTPNPETLPIESPLVFALQRMSVGGYRHVPLLNEKQEPVSVVSMRDIVEHIVALYPAEILNLPDQPTSWSGRDGG